MNLNCKLLSLSILFLIHLSSCEEGNTASMDYKSIIKENEVLKVNLSELSYIPLEEKKCNCQFSTNEKSFKLKQFIFVNDHIVTAYLNIDGVLTKFIMLNFKNTSSNTSISTYQANGYKLKVEMKHMTKKQRTQKKVGEITLKAYDGREVVKTFYGECNVKNE